ncbi:MAG TPA: D-arabinose 5-phosphate isomerase [Chitinophagaceae bacterium]|nr:D-arabinose 5-phosphate isomerase [Chitinophagaceae bacterium]
MEQDIASTALKTIRLEAESVAGLARFVDGSFVKAVECIHRSGGRVVVSGIGKSAIIAQKIVATLNSTGTPSLFLHAADAIHGDLGMVQPDDIVMLISKSGESPEIKVLVPLIRNFGNILIALCGNAKSFLAQEAQYFINCSVSAEACPNNLAPTSSTTAQLVMGDAMAVCLLQLKGFTPADFARYHPGGALGKRLYLRVKDLSKQHEKPSVHLNDDIRTLIPEMTGKRLGACAVLDEQEQLCGMITDGDIRRMLENHVQLEGIIAADIMNTQPKTIEGAALAVDALERMRNHHISQLIVLDDGRYDGMIHIHDLMREGLI